MPIILISQRNDPSVANFYKHPVNGSIALQQRSISVHLFLHDVRRMGRYFLKRMREENAQEPESHSTRSLLARTRRGVPQVVVVVVMVSRAKVRLGTRLEGNIQNGIPLTAIRSSQLGSMGARVKVSYPLVRFAAFFDTMLLPSVAAGIDWSIYRHDSSDSTRSRVEIPRGLFPLTEPESVDDAFTRLARR